MKKLWIVLIAIITLACGPEDAVPTAPVMDTFDPTTATLLREGMWMGSGGYTVTGTAKIYDDDGKLVLVLDPFMASNGPDLRVYLSKDTGASSFVNLGKMQSTNGKQSYSIPAGTDLEQFKFVLIWCQQFSVLFGKSETS